MDNCFTNTIQSTEFIGDSLDKINSNFINLKTAGCKLKTILDGVSTFGVNSISEGTGISIQSTSMVEIISELIPPLWCTGSTKAPLYTELTTSRVLEAITQNDLFLKCVQGTVNQNTIFSNYTTRANSTTTIFPGSSGFRGGINLLDGRVFFASSTVSMDSYLLDPRSQTVEILPNFPSTTTDSFWGSVLMPDGRVFCIPHNSTNAVIYTPYETTTNLFTTLNTGSPYPGNEAYLGGTLLKDGRILLSPYNTNDVAIYDPITNTKNLIPITTGVGAIYTPKSIYGCCLASNGKVLFVPKDTSTFWVLNNSNTALYAVNNTAPGGDAFRGAVTLANGNIFCVPYNSVFAAIYNPFTDIINYTNSVFPGFGAYETGTLLPDGRVFLMPAGNNSPGIYDPINDSLEIVNYSVIQDDFYGCLLTLDNKILMCPRNSTEGIYFTSSYSSGFLRGVITSPFFNKL